MFVLLFASSLLICLHVVNIVVSVGPYKFNIFSSGYFFIRFWTRYGFSDSPPDPNIRKLVKLYFPVFSWYAICSIHFGIKNDRVTWWCSIRCNTFSGFSSSSFFTSSSVAPNSSAVYMSIPEASNEYFSSDMHTSSWLAFSVLSFSMDLSEKYHILEIAVDRWNATQMIQNLEGEGFTIVPFGFPVEPDVYIIYATDSGKMLDVSSWTFGVFSMVSTVNIVLFMFFSVSLCVLSVRMQNGLQSFNMYSILLVFSFGNIGT